MASYWPPAAAAVHLTGMIGSRTGGGAVRIWAVGGWKQYAQFSDGFTGPAQCVAFSPDGTTLAAGGERYRLKGNGNPFMGSCIRFWDVAKRAEGRALELNGDQDHGGFVTQLAYAAAGNRLAVARTGRPSLLVTVTTRQIAYPFELTENSSVLAYAPDGKTVVGCNPPFPTLRLYRAEDGTLLASQSRRQTAGPK